MLKKKYTKYRDNMKHGVVLYLFYAFLTVKVTQIIIIHLYKKFLSDNYDYMGLEPQHIFYYNYLFIYFIIFC